MIYIALFRGINVGGKNRLPMRELVVALEAVGCRRVRTYIQSGNAAFESAEPDRARLSAAIGAETGRRGGFTPLVILLTLDEVETALAGNPFPDAEADPSHLHLSFFAGPPERPRLDELERLRTDTERFRLVGNVFYLHAPDGVGASRLAAAAPRLLGAPLTDRNWTTVCRLRDMARELAGSTEGGSHDVRSA